MSATPPQRRKPGPGRKPRDPGGRRRLQARATLNEPERARHEEWLRRHGWPAVPEADIVRAELVAAWARDDITSATAVTAA